MKKILLTISALVLSSGSALAAGNGTYYGTLSDGSWANGIQQQGSETAVQVQGNVYSSVADGTWMKGIGESSRNSGTTVSGNTLSQLADGSWFKDFQRSPVKIAGYGDTTRLD